MSELTFRIGAFNADTRAVPVTFTSGEIVHKRDVNAVLKADGSYDRAATKARVEEVAMGVAHKIAAGVITVPAPEPVSPEDTAVSE
ncbi:hypothetical protein [Novosphingobium mathurense]|uniref:Uncharacterized protein n=1 Tax=Novosphingobium mathurense TaxID=428990 RepID=A0A1U6INB8_9SPHN|nr:hypothetical protein [Novosphingobium mathurense]SLK09529.1 hypothetical protein SAMN06295987_11012 [Novosphingobium mathurense]